MLIYGTRSKSLGSASISGACPNCKRQNTLSSEGLRNYFHVYWIRLFSVGTEHLITCGFCKAAYDEEEFAAAMSAVKPASAGVRALSTEAASTTTTTSLTLEHNPYREAADVIADSGADSVEAQAQAVESSNPSFERTRPSTLSRLSWCEWRAVLLFLQSG